MPTLDAPHLAQISLLSSNKDVYEPSDDSFALVDSLSEAIGSGRLAPSLCIEIGCGSGYVICSIALLLVHHGIRSHCLAVDINPAAVQCSHATLAAHKVANVDLISCDLLQPLLQRLRGKVDLLVFNPPYVPTPDDEVHHKGITQAWAGGMRGRMVIDRILPLVPILLSPAGHFFMVTVAENAPEDICQQVEDYGLKGSIALRRQADEEQLTILHFERN